MSIFLVFVTGNNFSQILQQIEARDDAIRTFERGSTTPGVLSPGTVWNKTNYAWTAGSDDAWMRYNGSAHVLLLDPRYAQINDHGTVPMAADLPMGSHKITGLVAGTASGHAVEFDQFAALSAAAWGANHGAGGFLLTNLGSPFGQASDAVAARYDDTWQTTHGLMRYKGTPAFDTVYGSGVTTGNSNDGGKRAAPNTAVTFCPRVMYLKLSGAVTPIGGGSTAFTLAEIVLLVLRDPDNENVWFAPAGGTGLGGGGQWQVEVNLVTSGTLGFAVRIRRTSDNSLYQSAKIRAYAMSGVGMA